MKRYQKYLAYLLIFLFGAFVAIAFGKATNAIAFSNQKEAAVPKTFNQMVNEALAEVPTIKPKDAY